MNHRLLVDAKALVQKNKIKNKLKPQQRAVEVDAEEILLTSTFKVDANAIVEKLKKNNKIKRPTALMIYY
jgi:hypothetical protein